MLLHIVELLSKLPSQQMRRILARVHKGEREKEIQTDRETETLISKTARLRFGDTGTYLEPGETNLI